MKISELIALNESEAQIQLLSKKYEKQIITAWGGEKYHKMQKDLEDISHAVQNGSLDYDVGQDKVGDIIDNTNHHLNAAYELTDSRYELPTVEKFVKFLAREMADAPIPPKYMEWVIRQYIKDSYVIEDIVAISDDISSFDAVKQRLPADQRDINKYDRRDLQRLVAQAQTKSKNEIKKEEIAKLKHDIITIYDGPEGKIYVPKTQEASCYLGRGTRWCTAATTSKNYFDQYNRHGHLFVLITKDGTKYQYHSENIASNMNANFLQMTIKSMLADDQDLRVPSHAIPLMQNLVHLLEKAAEWQPYSFIPIFAMMRNVPMLQKIFSRTGSHIVDHWVKIAKSNMAGAHDHGAIYLAAKAIVDAAGGEDDHYNQIRPR